MSQLYSPYRPKAGTGLFFPAFAQSATSEQYLTYHNATFGITIQYPISWTAQELDASQGGIEHFSAPKVSAADSYVENVEIHYVDLPKGATLQTYTNILLQSDQINIDNFTALDASNSSSLAGFPANLIVFSGYYNAFKYQALSTWTVIGNRALIIIYYAEPDRYSAYLPSAKQMIKSIEVDPQVFGKATPSGIYRVPSLGLDAEIPPAWSIIDSGPGNSTLFKAAPSPFGIVNTTERVLIFGLTGQNGDVSKQFLHNSDRDFNCGTIHVASVVLINNKKALETELNCDDGMVLKKVKLYIFGTQQGGVIFIGYGADSISSYDKYLTDFDTSIQDLKLANATDLSDINYYASLLGLVKDRKEFVVEGVSRSIDFATNSNIVSFSIDQNSKRVSAVTSGQNKTALAFFRMTDLLQGPFVVIVDGKVFNEGVFEIVDKTIPQTYLQISYVPTSSNSAIHKIEIMGTDVAPEFPLLSTGMLLMGIGIALSIFLATRNLPYHIGQKT